MLTEAERMALGDFIGENWDKFKERAASHLSDEEIDALYEKLTGEKPD